MSFVEKRNHNGQTIKVVGSVYVHISNLTQHTSVSFNVDECKELCSLFFNMMNTLKNKIQKKTDNNNNTYIHTCCVSSLDWQTCNFMFGKTENDDNNNNNTCTVMPWWNFPSLIHPWIKRALPHVIKLLIIDKPAQYTIDVYWMI